MGNKSIAIILKLRLLFLVLLATTINYQLSTMNYLYAQDKIVAVVNNDVITQRDLDEFVNFMRMQLASELSGKELEIRIHEMKLDLLGKLVEDRLILQEALKEGLRVDPDRINNKVNEIKKRYDSEDDFQKALSMQGLTRSDIEAKIKEQILMYSIIEYKIKSKITVKPTEVTLFYEQNKDGLTIPQQRIFSYLAVENQPLAKAMLARLKNNEPMEEVAKSTGANLNQINITRKGQLREEVEEKISKLNPGQTSGLIENEGKYYIFKLNTVIPERKQTLQEAQDNIYNFLFEQKMQEQLLEWLENLKKRSYIKIIP